MIWRFELATATVQAAMLSKIGMITVFPAHQHPDPVDEDRVIPACTTSAG